jgi:DUF971 family protein
MTLPGLPANSDEASLRWVSERELAIDWQDGHISFYPLTDLRRACPCAGCKGESLFKPLLPRRPPKVAEDIRALKVEPVGRYAIRIYWSDGHNTGFYRYEYLRRLCPCAECQAAQKA